MTKSRGDSYMIVLHEKTLEIEMKPYKEGIQPLYDLIECDMIDHSSAIDDLNKRHIDMWVDDEGMLKSRCPVFVFLDDEDNVQGQIVGNVVFQKSDNKGESYGLSLEEAQNMFFWINAHDRVTVELYNGVICSCYVIRPHETKRHRQKMQDMVRWAEENGWQIFKM